MEATFLLCSFGYFASHFSDLFSIFWISWSHDYSADFKAKSSELLKRQNFCLCFQISKLIWLNFYWLQRRNGRRNTAEHNLRPLSIRTLVQGDQHGSHSFLDARLQTSSKVSGNIPTLAHQLLFEMNYFWLTTHFLSFCAANDRRPRNVWNTVGCSPASSCWRNVNEPSSWATGSRYVITTHVWPVPQYQTVISFYRNTLTPITNSDGSSRRPPIQCCPHSAWVWAAPSAANPKYSPHFNNIT